MNEVQREMREFIVADIVENTDLDGDTVRDQLMFNGPVRAHGETWTSFTWIEEDGHDTILVRYDLTTRSYVIGSY